MNGSAIQIFVDCKQQVAEHGSHCSEILSFSFHEPEIISYMHLSEKILE